VLVLSSATAAGWLTGYVHAVTIFAPAYADAVGRVILASGDSAYVPQNATPGAANSEPVVAPVTITRIKLLPEGAVQWVEVTNHTDAAIPLYATGAPSVTWMLDQLLFRFPPGVTLGAHERLLVANALPTTVCTQEASPQGRRVMGVAALPPAAGGGVLRLLAPQPTGATGGYTYAVVDEVRFDGVERLRLLPDATFWQRSADANPGFDPASWFASNASLIGDDASIDPANLCAFDVYRDTEGRVRVEWVTRALSAEQHFVLWRSMSSDRSTASVVADDDQTRVVGVSGVFQWLDADLTLDDQPFYWLQLLTDTGASDVAVSGVRTSMSVSYLPVVAQQP
jgi:hypothetical protein